MKEVDAPAIVKETDAISVNDLAVKIKESWVRYQARGREFSHEGESIGEWLMKIKARIPGKFKEWVGANLPFTYDYARRLIRLFAEAKNDRENPAEQITADISLSQRLQRNLKILSDDSSEQEDTSNGDGGNGGGGSEEENDENGDNEDEYDAQAEVNEKCSPAIKRAVRTNEITVEDAAEISGESHARQDKALDAVRLGKATTLKEAIAKMVKKKRKKKKPTPPEDVVDGLGNPVPARCRDAFADPSLKELIEELEQAEALVRAEPWLDRATKLTDHYQFLLIDKFKTHSVDALRSLQLAVEALQSGMPYAVCPKCNGEENGKVCRSCRGGGHIPLHRYEELTRDSV